MRGRKAIDSWRPIGTAPVDGTWIRVRSACNTEHRVSWGRNRLGASCWCTETGWLASANLTHWRPDQLTVEQIVMEQANDEGLWFIAETAAEAYLQQELRRLHAAIEGKSPDECAKTAIARVAPAKPNPQERRR